MHPRLLEYYNRELAYLYELGSEFAEQYPKVAARLGMRGLEVEDPYVERLLEGFAFLSARIQLKYDAEFPRLSQRLLEVIYPNYLAPTPAMCVVQMGLPADKAAVSAGFKIERGSLLRSRIPREERTACEFRTAHAMTLWPLDLVAARVTGAVAGAASGGASIRSALRLRFGITSPINQSNGALERLTLYIRAPDDIASRLYEKIFSSTVAVRIAGLHGGKEVEALLPQGSLVDEGFDDKQALLPYAASGFQGYRLLHEYFAFPARFWFFSIRNIGAFLQRLDEAAFEVVLMFDTASPELEALVNADHFALHCVPAVNLTTRRTDRLQVAGNRLEYHVVADRARPLDFEVYSVAAVEGYGADNALVTSFRPFYESVSSSRAGFGAAYFSVRREPRRMSDNARRHGTRTEYTGSEVFLSLVDQSEAPFSGEIEQLGIEVLVTNRDLPMLMPVGGASDFSLVSSAPVSSIKIIRGPTRPSPAFAEQEIAWRLISHLSINYLSLADLDATELPQTLHKLLQLYSSPADAGTRKQIEGFRTSAARAITRRLPGNGPLMFGRGTAVDITVDESSFSGTSPFLIGAVLDRFLARHASLNSFVELTLHSAARGKIHTWPVRSGGRPIA